MPLNNISSYVATGLYTRHEVGIASLLIAPLNTDSVKVGIPDQIMYPECLREAARVLIDKANELDGGAALPASSPVYPQGYAALTDQAKKVYQHMKRAGHITARAAMADYGISSGAMTKRIVDIQRAGFKVLKERVRHPIHGRLYTRYSLAA